MKWEHRKEEELKFVKVRGGRLKTFLKTAEWIENFSYKM